MKKKPAPKPAAAPSSPPVSTANTNEPEWVDDRELAKRTPITRMGWQQWRIRRRGPPYYKVGKRVLYRWSEVLAWLESNRTEPKRKAC